MQTADPKSLPWVLMLVLELRKRLWRCFSDGRHTSSGNVFELENLNMCNILAISNVTNLKMSGL